MIKFWKAWASRKIIVEPSIKVQVVASNTLTLLQWRKQQTLVESAIRLSRDSTFQMALAVLRNEHPSHLAFPSTNTSPADRAAMQSRIEGYELCLNNLEALSKPFKPSQRIEATFEPPKTK